MTKDGFYEDKDFIGVPCVECSSVEEVAAWVSNHANTLRREYLAGLPVVEGKLDVYGNFYQKRNVKTKCTHKARLDGLETL